MQSLRGPATYQIAGIQRRLAEREMRDRMPGPSRQVQFYDVS